MATQPAFDVVIHAPNRLQITAMLAPVEALDFASIREALHISDSVLSKHLKVLVEAEYVSASKTPHGSRTRTWLTLTPTGHAALAGHLAELRRIAAMATIT